MNVRGVQNPFKEVRKVSKYTQVFLRTIKSPGVYFFALTGNTVMATAIFLFHYFEQGINPQVNTVFDSIWWGMSTVTTVGYGDIVPVTVAGRWVSLGLMALGVVLFVSFTAMLVSVFYAIAEEEILATKKLSYKEYEQLMAEIKSLNKKIDHLTNPNP